MTNEETDFLAEGIGNRQIAIAEGIKELTGTPDDHIKVRKLLELLGEASGEITFVRDQLLNSKKPVRKFALLLKV